jgi:type I restriction enzyme S subunit
LTVPKLNQGSLREIPIPVPPLAEQQAIVTQLDALAAETQRLTRLYEQKQAALAALKKSLLHQAFTGAL